MKTIAHDIALVVFVVTIPVVIVVLFFMMVGLL